MADRPLRKYETELHELGLRIVNALDECDPGEDRAGLVASYTWNALFGYAATIPVDARIKALEADAAALHRDITERKARLEQAEAERDEAREWVRRMHRESQVLTCVYCGHAYPPGTPASGSEALTAHVAVCSKHPMAPLRAFVQELADDWTRDGRRGDHPELAKAAFDLLNPEVPHG